MKRIWIAAALAAVAALAGCTDESGEEYGLSYGAMAQGHEGMNRSIAGLPVTTAAEMPTTGNVGYHGFGAVALDTATPTQIYGESHIFVDFEGGTVSGGLRDLRGSFNGNPDIDVDGRIELSDITLGQDGAFQTNLNGTVIAEGYSLVVDGGTTGTFRTEDGVGAAAILLSSTADTEFLLNGMAVEGRLDAEGQR